MKFKKGDKVKFLNEDDKGTVTRVLENGTIMVLNSDDFEVPAKASELIIDPTEQPIEIKEVTKNSYQNSSEKSNKSEVSQKSEPIEEEEEEYVKPNNTIEIFSGFVPENANKPEESNLDFYLINDSNYKVCYNYIKPVGKVFSMKVGVLEPNTKEYIENISRMDLTQIPFMKFQFLFAENGHISIKTPVEKEIKIHAPKFFQELSYKTNDFFEEKAIISEIYNDSDIAEAKEKLIKSLENKDINKIVREKEQKSHVNKSIKPESDKLIIDLHITELIDDERGMSAKEILDLQMKTFREKMDASIKNPHIKKVVFIHGKGNGTLKLEVRKELDRKYRKYSYQDASFEEYGGGATLVYVK
ncbi:MAG: DUF2027 domain-containing protein [Bacteroidales bacterium]|nr:DUF2027 domain-containing protein [Bacteroidales bacterium]